MKTKNAASRSLKRQWGIIVVGLAWVVGPGAMATDIHLDMLKTRTDTFTNVTVYGRSKTDIFIRHSQGFGNIKVASLDPETMARLNGESSASAASGFTKSAGGEAKPEKSAATEAASKASALTAELDAKLRQQMMSSMAALKGLSAAQVSPTVVGLILGVMFVAYLFLCHCLKLICLKTGNDPGILIWLPVLQMIPLLRAAGMSGWWFLGLFVPLVNVVVQIVWCFKIVQARGKSVLAAIGLLLPLTNLLALLYLAFSNGKSEELPRYHKVVLAEGPLAVET